MSQAKKYWFAYDATGCGSLQDNRLWWDEFIVSGPDLGYYPKARKCWLVIKPGKEELLRASLKRRQSTSHWKALGCGSRLQILSRAVRQRLSGGLGGTVTKLAEFALSQPITQRSYLDYVISENSA